MSKAKELKNKIERIPSFEDKLGIRYDNISIITDDNPDMNYIDIVGDMIEMDRKKISKEVSINTKVTIYDSDNDIIFTGEDSISSDDFLGFYTFDIFFGSINLNNISKILVYPY